MLQLVREARDAKDSLGGMITCMIHNVPTGIGEPVFDKVLYIYMQHYIFVSFDRMTPLLLLLVVGVVLMNANIVTSSNDVDTSSERI